MTPSNNAHTNNSILSGDQLKIETKITSKLAANSKQTKGIESNYDKVNENTSMTNMDSSPETRMLPKPLKLGSS